VSGAGKQGGGHSPVTPFFEQHLPISCPNAPAKWISKDGLSLTLVFSGVKPNDAFCTRAVTLLK
jgi:hypothetical protein